MRLLIRTRNRSIFGSIIGFFILLMVIVLIIAGLFFFITIGSIVLLVGGTLVGISLVLYRLFPGWFKKKSAVDVKYRIIQDNQKKR